MIVRVATESPEYLRGLQYPNGAWQMYPLLRLPDLRLVSDVMSLEYAHSASVDGHRAMNFKYLINYGVVNRNTADIIDVILALRGYTEIFQGRYVARPW
jgi:hypothetical protein